MNATILVRVSGRDRPGITAGLMDLLAEGGVEVHDVEQVTVRGRLNLGLLLGVPEGVTTIKDLVFYGWERDLHIDFEVVEADSGPAAAASVVTLIAPVVTAEAFGAVARAIAENGGNIDRIARLSRHPVVSYELAVSAGDVTEMRRALGAAAAHHEIDVAVQAEGLYRRAKRLVVMDVDSTLVRDEAIDLLAAEAGVGEQVRAMTAAAMEGSVEFTTSLRQRVRLLAGLEVEALDRVSSAVRLTPGALTFVRTLKRLGMKVAIVSGGFTFITDRLARELRLDHAAANVLEIRDGRLTGELLGPVVDRVEKARVLLEVARQEGIPAAQTVAIGDGANDLDMLAAAGLGIAFNARPVVREAADTSLTVPYLDAILFLLGIRRDDIEAAEAGDAEADQAW